jgi:drug/metabolite transporter (DMT)-like permease
VNPWMIGLAAALFGNILYHLMSRSASAGGKPFTMLAIVYALATGLAVTLAVLAESARPADLLRPLGMPAVAALALAVVMIEAGFLWAYGQGAPVSTSSLLVNAGVAVVLALLGVVLFREGVNARLIGGFALALAGVWLIGTARATP